MKYINNYKLFEMRCGSKIFDMSKFTKMEFIKDICYDVIENFNNNISGEYDDMEYGFGYTLFDGIYSYSIIPEGDAEKEDVLKWMSTRIGHHQLNTNLGYFFRFDVPYTIIINTDLDKNIGTDSNQRDILKRLKRKAELEGFEVYFTITKSGDWHDEVKYNTILFIDAKGNK